MTRGAPSRRSSLRSLGLVLLAASTSAFRPPARAQVDPRAAEYHIKAAFLCKFGNYIEWPAQAFAERDSPFVIGVVAGDEVSAEVVRTATNALVRGRRIVVRRMRNTDALAGVHLLFVARSAERQLDDWLAAARGQATLIVTESPRGPLPGGGINFVVVDDRVRFDVALPTERPGLRISSDLLGVARVVVGRNAS